MRKLDPRIVAICLVFLIFLAVFASLARGPLGLLAIIVLSALGAISALAAFTGTDPFLELLHLIRPGPKYGHATAVLNVLIAHRRLVRSETIGLVPIYRIDHHYWTNLQLKYAKLTDDTEVVNALSDYVETLIGKSNPPPSFVQPEELDDPSIELYWADAHSTLRAVVKKLGGQFVPIGAIQQPSQVVVLAAVYSPRIRLLLEDKCRCIRMAICLLGPDKSYLEATLGDLAGSATRWCRTTPWRNCLSKPG